MRDAIQASAPCSSTPSAHWKTCSGAAKSRRRWTPGSRDSIASPSADQWSETGELPVRMGINIGPAQRRGVDYFGPTLNRCARLMGVGHGGQVLLSGMARGEPAGGFYADDPVPPTRRC